MCHFGHMHTYVCVCVCVCVCMYVWACVYVWVCKRESYWSQSLFLITLIPNWITHDDRCVRILLRYFISLSLLIHFIYSFLWFSAIGGWLNNIYQIFPNWISFVIKWSVTLTECWFEKNKQTNKPRLTTKVDIAPGRAEVPRSLRNFWAITDKIITALNA